MRQFSIITSQPSMSSSTLTICKAILAEQGLRYTEISDVKGAITLSRGKINPADGFVIVTPDENILLDYFDLVYYIETRGLKKI